MRSYVDILGLRSTFGQAKATAENHQQRKVRSGYLFYLAKSRHSISTFVSCYLRGGICGTNPSTFGNCRDFWYSPVNFWQAKATAENPPLRKARSGYVLFFSESRAPLKAEFPGMKVRFFTNPT